MRITPSKCYKCLDNGDTSVTCQEPGRRTLPQMRSSRSPSEHLQRKQELRSFQVSWRIWLCAHWRFGRCPVFSADEATLMPGPLNAATLCRHRGAFFRQCNVVREMLKSGSRWSHVVHHFRSLIFAKKTQLNCWRELMARASLN